MFFHLGHTCGVSPEKKSEYKSHPKVYFHMNLVIEELRTHCPENQTPSVLPNPPKPLFTPLGTFLLLKARRKNGIWRQVANSRGLGCSTSAEPPGMPWAVLPSRGDLEAKPGQEDLGGENAAGTQEKGGKLREDREFPSHFTPILHLDVSSSNCTANFCLQVNFGFYFSSPRC